MTNEQISAECSALEKLLIAKHANYGSSAERRPCLIPGISPGEAIFVRMSDKVARIAALNKGQADKVGESLADTVRDLAGYCILWLAYHEEKASLLKDFDCKNTYIPGNSFHDVPNEIPGGTDLDA